MKRKPYRFLLYLLLELAAIIAFILPYKVALFLGSLAGSFAYAILRKYRDTALDNLRFAFAGEKDEREIEKIARDVFRNLGITGAECLSLRKLKKIDILRLVEERNISRISEMLSRGKGVIVLSSHLGNWEMASIRGAAEGYDVTVIARRIYYHRYDKFLVSLRSSKGVKTLYRDDKRVLRKSLEVLSSNKVLGIVPDQDVDSVDGVFVNFFDRPAYTPTGPVNLAMLSGAPILPAFTIRKNGKLHLLVDGPIYVEKGGDRKKDIVEYTQKWSSVVERYIRAYPLQWVWLHRRWKTKPKRGPA